MEASTQVVLFVWHAKQLIPDYPLTGPDGYSVCDQGTNAADFGHLVGYGVLCDVQVELFDVVKGHQRLKVRIPRESGSLIITFPSNPAFTQTSC